MTCGPPPRPDARASGERPLHRRPRLVALVALGGAGGTAVRATVAGLSPAAGGWPWAIWAINVVGAFALGLLLERLARAGPDDGPRRTARLALGTGFLGGCTTYSALALDTVTLAGSGAAVTALVYAGSTVLAGLAAAAVGIAVGARTGRGPRQHGAVAVSAGPGRRPA